VLAVLDLLTTGGAVQQRLFVRAAARAGQGRLVEALELHLERARLAPESAAPRLDAARTLRRMAAAAREVLRETDSRAHLSRALGTLARGIELAVASGDGPSLQRLLTERARCLLDLGDPLAALADLDQVLERDPTDFEAFSTRLACQRALRRAEAGPSPASGAGATVVAAPAAAPTGEEDPLEEVPALSMERLLPGRAELTESLETAGRDLQSIYRGLQQLLQEPEEPTGDEPAAEAPGGGEAATSQGGG
jgi:tetratricopeptide (TPR) repeat protein